MAINASMVWRVRAGGSNNNGAGFDAAVASAGSDFSDQDAAQLALTDIVAIGTTTLTSVTGGFTAAMIGNVIKLRSFTASGQTGYRVITARTDTNTITVDSNVTAGTGGSGNVGGASATLLNFTSAGSAGTPAVTSPLAAGHIVYVRGAGSDAPSSADYTHTGNATFANGNETAGAVKFIGYNGRPRINSDALFWYNGNYQHFENFMMVPQNETSNNFGIFNSVSNCSAYNCVVDVNGKDLICFNLNSTIACRMYNSGGTTSGAQYAIVPLGFGAEIFGNVINAVRGGGIKHEYMAEIAFNIIANTKGSGLPGILMATTTSTYGGAIHNNTIYGGASDGIKLSTKESITNTQILNNIIANNGGYGLNCSVGTTALNDRTKRVHDYNCFFTNTSGARNACSAGSHDSTLDPTFTNAAAGDFSIGTNLKALAFPGVFPGGLSTGALDMGACQRVEAGGGGGPLIGPGRLVRS